MRLFLSPLLLFISLTTQAQVSFKTIVPQQPVVQGESFVIQYIVEGAEKTGTLAAPSFNGIKLVAGPAFYAGTNAALKGVQKVTNIVYTLKAIRPGRFVVPPATIMVNGKQLVSNEAVLVVITEKQANEKLYREQSLANPDYFLAPGEDPFAKMSKNLFVRLAVNKKKCFAGEPVLATFKLYSRLESKSDISKNPGFYGFTVYDMENLSDKKKGTETVNGKIFDVHTIRKVQLYPLQPGVFSIDPMVIKNEVTFSTSKVSKKTEQEISEGIHGNEPIDTPAEGTVTYESELETEPITIDVLPLPEKNKPLSFSGATGKFSIAASSITDTIAKNEQGLLEISITGKGNFVQLEAPAIQWPAGVEGFEPAVADDLDKTQTPLSGVRRFRYAFVSAAPGTYTIPATVFSYFDTDSNKYVTIHTKPVSFTVSNASKKVTIEETSKTSIADESEKSAQRAGLIVVALVGLVLLYWVVKKKEPVKRQTAIQEIPLASAEEVLTPAFENIDADNKLFYAALQNGIWQFASQRFNLAGSISNKIVLKEKMTSVGVEETASQQLLWLLEQCEAGLFTNADLEHDRNELLATTKLVLDKMTAQKG
jgi:BatD DUF11 like domain